MLRRGLVSRSGVASTVLRQPTLHRFLAYQGAPNATNKPPIQGSDSLDLESGQNELKKSSSFINASRVIDKEADEQEMEQVSREMEDAITKEKEVHDSEQVDKKSKTWDISSEQSRTQEMMANNKEQQELLKRGFLPDEGMAMSDNRYTEKYDSDGSLIEKVKHTMSDATKSVKEISHDLTEATMKSMSTLTEIAKGMMGSTPPSEQSNDAKSSNPKPDETSVKAKETEEKKPRCKQFSEHRQNSSLL